MSALESIARRGACAVAAATLILSGAGAEVLSSHSIARVDQAGLSRQGDKLEFAFRDPEFAVEPTWTVSYDESAELNCAAPHSLVWVIFTSPSPGNPERPECMGGGATTTLLAWYPAVAQLSNPPLRNIDGIIVEGPVPRGRWAEYSLPAEHYVFYAEGPDASAILRTISYSARASLAHLTSALPVPAT